MKFGILETGLSHQCNLSCSFCYEKTKRPSAPADVTRTVRHIEWFLDEAAHKDSKVALCLGEPTLDWDALKDLVERVPDVGRWELVTNMTLMDQERVAWCFDHNMIINPSIDGCPEVQAKQRTLSNVYRIAKLILEKRSSTTCRSTITPESAQFMSRSLMFLNEEIGFTSINQVLATGIEWPDEAAQTLREQARISSTWWLDKIRQGKLIRLRWLTSALESIWQPLRLRQCCGAGLNTIAVDTDGSIWPCHRFCNSSANPAFHLGNVKIGIENQALLKRIQGFDVAREWMLRCSDCPGVLSCRAACWHEGARLGSNTPVAPSIYCKVWPAFHAEALRVHAILDAERNETYLEAFGNAHSRRDETT